MNGFYEYDHEVYVHIWISKKAFKTWLLTFPSVHLSLSHSMFICDKKMEKYCTILLFKSFGEIIYDTMMIYFAILL